MKLRLVRTALALVSSALPCAAWSSRATFEPAVQAPTVVPDRPSTTSGTDAPGSDEGPLDNDTEVPTNQAAEVLLRAAEDARTKAGSAAPDSEAFVPVLEAWRKALLSTSPLDDVAGDAARDADPDGTRARRAEGVGRCVMRLIRSAGAGASFQRRFEATATRALDAAGSDPDALARVEHENPFTRAAAIAALRRADLALEVGDLELARTWLARGVVHASIAGDEAVRGALARRDAEIGGAATPSSASPGNEDPGPNASALRLVRTIDLAPEKDEGFPPAPHLCAGIAFAPDGSAWIQSNEHLFRLTPDLALTRFDPVALAAPHRWLPAFGESTYEWIQEPLLLPAGTGPGGASGTDIVIVCGRAKENRGNALLCLDPLASKLRWAWTDEGFVGSGEDAGGEDPLLPGRLEFQPAPCRSGARILVLVKQWTPSDPGERTAKVDEGRNFVWLVALDATTGRAEWKRLLATGADLRAHRERFLLPRGVSHPCAPLALEKGRVLAQTELGVLSCVEAADGRLAWSLRTARAGREDLTWKAGRGPVRAPRGSDRAGSWVVAPGDADRIVYRLAAQDAGDPAPDQDGGLLLHPPRRVADMQDLVAAGACDLVLVSRHGSRTRLSTLDTWTGARVDSLPFPRACEAVQGATANDRQVLCAAGGALFVFDRAHELRLEARVDAPGLERESSARLHVRDGRVYLVAATHVWVFEAR